ncbi:MAG: NTP transferase domain-containing protein [Candidatus Nitrosotenuis sp.]
MSTTYLFIIAAGKGSRFNPNKPKALVEINGVPNIINTINHAKGIFDRIIVVCNVYFRDWFEDVIKNRSDVFVLPIKSGLGDGHAIREAIIESPFPISRDIVIMWGDAYVQSPAIFQEIRAEEYDSYYGEVGTLPVMLEENPYVAFKLDEENSNYCQSVDFSKKGEINVIGYHDQSIFKMNTLELITALDMLHNAFWKSTKYVTDTGELTFLYVIHYFHNTGKHVKMYQTVNSVLAFNTVEELNQIELLLK